MKFLGKIFTPKTFVGTVLAGLVLYAILRMIDPLWSNKKKSIKLYGSVLEKKEKLTPIYNASVNFLNICEERTDSNGRFSTELYGTGHDSITIEFSIPGRVMISKKYLVDYHKKEIFIDPVIFPVPESASIKEPIRIELSPKEHHISPSFGKTRNHNIQDSIINQTQKSESNLILANSDIADYAVIGLTNGARDIQLTNIIVSWLRKSGSMPHSITQSLFIEQEYLDQIFAGRSKVIIKTNAKQVANNVCLIRSILTYSTSKVEESLVIANCNNEVIILESTTGKIIDNFIHTGQSSGISQEMAKKRVTDDFINYLKNRKLTI